MTWKKTKAKLLKQYRKLGFKWKEACYCARFEFPNIGLPKCGYKNVTSLLDYHEDLFFNENSHVLILIEYYNWNKTDIKSICYIKSQTTLNEWLQRCDDA